MSDYEEKRTLYSNKPGPHNTNNVIHAVKARVREGNVTTIVVASISGHTALRVAEELGELGILSIQKRWQAREYWLSLDLNMKCSWRVLEN